MRGDSFIASFNADNGEEIWKRSRDEYPTWSTPNIYIEDGRDYVVVNGYKHRGAYDFLTGEEIWRMSGGGDIPIPTPVIGDGMIYFNSAHGRFSPIMAVKTNAKGDITLKEGETSNDAVVWSIPRGGSYIHTLLLYDGLLYNMKWNGQFSCFDPATGEEIYREKLGKADSFIASPVAADGKIYIISDQGMVYTISAGRLFKVIEENSLGEVCMIVPAITENIIYFRTEDHLIAISKEQ
ncbi:Outer membrane protein assembly factor BamB [subsurface metagenome]